MGTFYAGGLSTLLLFMPKLFSRYEHLLPLTVVTTLNRLSFLRLYFYYLSLVMLFVNLLGVRSGIIRLYYLPINIV